MTSKLVPVEPTEEMIAAACDGMFKTKFTHPYDIAPDYAKAVWKAMLAAAPERTELCGGPDNICLVAEARGEHNRCTGKCAYESVETAHPVDVNCAVVWGPARQMADGTFYRTGTSTGVAMPEQPAENADNLNDGEFGMPIEHRTAATQEEIDISAAWFEVMEHLCPQRTGGYDSYLSAAKLIVQKYTKADKRLSQAENESRANYKNWQEAERQLAEWYRAASPYATPGALKDGLAEAIRVEKDHDD